MTGGNLPNTFGFKKEKINVNPLGTYFTLLLQNVIYYNQCHYMTTCDKKEECKTVRYICDSNKEHTNRFPYTMGYNRKHYLS